MKYTITINGQEDTVVETDDATVGDIQQTVARFTPEMNFQVALAIVMAMRMNPEASLKNAPAAKDKTVLAEFNALRVTESDVLSDDRIGKFLVTKDSEEFKDAPFAFSMSPQPVKEFVNDPVGWSNKTLEFFPELRIKLVNIAISNVEPL